jgi:hypothetical protein
VQYNIVPSSKRVVIKKNILISWPCQVLATGTPVGNTLFNTLNGKDAPRFLPVGQNFTSVVVSFDGVSSQIQNSNAYIDAMCRFADQSPESKNKHQSTFPSTQDPLGPGISNYSANPGCFDAFGASLKNPLTNGLSGRDQRGDFSYQLNPPLTPDNNAGNTQTASFVSVEPILGLQLMGQTCTSQEPGFYNVGLMSMTFTLQAKPRFWSHWATGAVWSDDVHSFYDTPQALLEYWTPPDLLVPSLPLYYPISKIVQFQGTPVTLAAGATETCTFGSIQVSSIPQALLMFASPSAGQQLSSDTKVVKGTCFAMDNYAGIPSCQLQGVKAPPINKKQLVSLTFDNDTSLLADATAEQLYSIAIQNGLQATSFNEWKAFGGIHKIMIGKDLQLQGGRVPGSQGTYNIQASFQIQNNFSQQVVFTPQFIVIQEGHYEIGATQNSSDVDTLTATDLSKARGIDEPAGKGKGMFGTLANIANYIPLVNTMSGLFHAVAPIADSLAGTEYKGEGLKKKKKKLAKKRGREECGGYTVN